MRTFKNIFLMLLVNIGIIFTLSIIISALGLDRALYANGLNYTALAVFCLVWGMGGAIISLLISRMMVKWIMGVKVFARGEGDLNIQRVYSSLERVVERAGLKTMPEMGIYDSPEMNAFATGPSQSRALVAVSTGLVNRMTEDELEGVLAHEVAHIKNGDMITMTLLQGIVNALVMFLARIIAFFVAGQAKESQRYWIQFMVTIVCQIVLGLVGVMIVAKFSRYREFHADAGGAKFAGKQKMIAALEALKRRFEPLDARGASLAAFKIETGEKRNGFFALMATHPPLDERIAALRNAL